MFNSLTKQQVNRYHKILSFMTLIGWLGFLGSWAIDKEVLDGWFPFVPQFGFLALSVISIVLSEIFFIKVEKQYGINIKWLMTWKRLFSFNLKTLH